jgi:hypothetical protein
VLAKRLAHALSVLAQTLPNPWDESTDYFTPFSAEMPDSEPMTVESLGHALAVGPKFHLDLDGVDLAQTGADYGDPVAAQGFSVLGAVMNATLTNLTRVTARAPGVVRVRTWVIGRLAGGWLVGLRTESTET